MKIRKKYLLYVLALLSAATGAVVVSIDGIISSLYVNDPWELGLSEFLVGSLITVLLVALLSVPIKGKSLGSAIDPSFSGLRFVKKKEIGYHVLAGIGNAFTTIGYFLVISLSGGESTTVLSFTYVMILYMLVIESISEKNAPTIAEVQSSLIVTFGAIMASMSFTEGINVGLLAIVFLLLNPTWVIFSICQRKLKLMKIDDKPNDAINIRLWNVIFTTIFISILVFFVKPVCFFNAMQTSVDHFWIIALSMGTTFFSYVLYIRALGMGKASVVQSLNATSLLFAIPITIYLSIAGLITAALYEGPAQLIIKIIGLSLVVLGVLSFALSEVKAYVFINMEPGYPIKETLDKIWDIKGVESVSVISGKHSFLARVRTRTLGKGYENILRKLEAVPGIESLKWASVLREWDNI
ncbi:MAG: Lrp/AsnC ligand binding domain-containing protein [Candidatus Thermoplasmatota archaeon]|nr:Lrp/AsnC ligand binding domain-containing protein [Candidatus Thermoplasmatota archaeon]